jgi:hypothetical protein
MNVSEIPKPKHGDQKNWRIEQEDISKSTFKDASGNEFEMVTHSSEQSVSERFCASCDKWVTAKGIFGGIWCPDCKTTWS